MVVNLIMLLPTLMCCWWFVIINVYVTFIIKELGWHWQAMLVRPQRNKNLEGKINLCLSEIFVCWYPHGQFVLQKYKIFWGGLIWTIRLYWVHSSIIFTYWLPTNMVVSEGKTPLKIIQPKLPIILVKKKVNSARYKN